MTARICFVVSSPMTLKAFLGPHVAAMRARHSVTVVAHFGADAAATQAPGVEWVSIPIERRVALWGDLRALWLLLRLFRRSRFAAIQSVTPKAGLLAMLAGWMARVPVRVHVFTGQVWVTRAGLARWFLKRMDRVIAACATHVIVDSASQREFLIEQGVIDAHRSRVLGKGSISGVDATRFRPDAGARSALRAELGCDGDSVVFLFLGRLNRDKGVPELAAAFAQIAARDPRPRLVVVGPDEDGSQPRMLAALGAAAARAAFVSYTDHPERYMAAADVFCLPSYREGFGTTIIEAAACGVPAIASRIYGITDAIEDGATGLLCAPADAGALAACMDRLARDPDLRLALGERARERALRDFSATAITAELVSFYDSLTGSSR